MTNATRLTSEQLQEVLTKHRAWLLDQAIGVRADLSRADLSRADLSGANLSRADLSRADLSGAYLFEGWKVESYRDLLWIGPLGSRHDFLMVNVPTLRLKAGCFEGTVDDFLAKVEESHGNNEYAREYGATVAYLRSLVDARRIAVQIPAAEQVEREEGVPIAD